MGTPLPERVAGIDIMYHLLQLACKKNYSVFFLGAKPDVVKKVARTAQKNYPGLHLAGFRDGYFDKTEENQVAEQIKQSNADILFVGISSPKKENFLRSWRSVINVPVCHGVGGSFDVVAGITKRAPLWMQNAGLEWLFRLMQEPRRMWKRYMITNSIFIKLSIQEIFKTRLSLRISRHA